jgi:Mrp family chromosome partitioning ATPase
MSQAESSRFKKTIIDAEWTAAPLSAEDEARRVRVTRAIMINGPKPSPTSLALRPATPIHAIIQHSRPSPVVVLEEVGLPASLDPRLVVLREPSSAQARSYRLLHHRLIARSDPRVIAVTSARPGEGKTTCAANLALALSDETFARVLLIEANVPRPGLAGLFGFEPSDSFISRLVQHQDATPPYGVTAIRGTRLHVAALHPDEARDKRLDRLLLDMAVRDLRQGYDYIIIDAASVLESADADVAGECADGVIVTARASKSRKSWLRRAIDQLSPATVLGVVLLDT